MLSVLRQSDRQLWKKIEKTQRLQ